MGFIKTNKIEKADHTVVVPDENPEDSLHEATWNEVLAARIAAELEARKTDDQ